jgi:acetoin utilization deacetylase AcuC-like enzyme
MPSAASPPDGERRAWLRQCGLLGLGLLAPAAWSALPNPERRTGYVFAPEFLSYVLAPGHVESPERARAIVAAMTASGLVGQVRQLAPASADTALAATMRVHSALHMETVARQRPEHHRESQVGVAASLSALEAVCGGQVDNAFVASRPPGHHALDTGREEGFCYYNNIAIAARHARARFGIERILICDWDYHHGNATEASFYRDADTLFFSTHDLEAYPFTGYADRTGEGPGAGSNINVPLPCGATDADILAAFRQRLLPAAQRFRPELVLISAGFDSRVDDLLGCFAVTDAGFRALTELVLELADQHAGGRVVSILEGGYQPSGTASAVVSHVGALAGVSLPELDPAAEDAPAAAASSRAGAWTSA